MSRASISTGNILFTGKQDDAPKAPKRSNNDKPMHIAIIGDFSGRASRGESEATALTKRKAIAIDRDNFEEVFSRLNVELRLPLEDSAIAFKEFDDLHPDFIYQRVGLFDKFRTLKRQLNKPELFQQAADEILQWSALKDDAQVAQTPAEENSAEPEAGIPLPASMLDAVLAQSSEVFAQQSTPLGNIDQLIKDIVAPYVEAKIDPRLADLENAVDQATAHTLRKIMHASDFRELEANWRAVYLLIRRIETQGSLKLFLFDISREEMVDDLINCEGIESSQMYRLFVEQAQMPGAVPFSVMQFNTQLQDDIDDVRLASAMASIAAANNAIAITGASEKLAGCENIESGEDIEDWDYRVEDNIVEAWASLRASESSAHLALAAPRFLLRLPYGKRTSPIDSFDFEELQDTDPHAFYCWGNSATLVTVLLAQSYSQYGWEFKAGQINEVGDLPLHIYQEDGESMAKACAEIYMRDSVANKLAEFGIMSVRSIKDKTAVLIPRFRTVSLNGTDIFQTA